jgi:hypothetical protein
MVMLELELFDAQLRFTSERGSRKRVRQALEIVDQTLERHGREVRRLLEARSRACRQDVTLKFGLGARIGAGKGGEFVFKKLVETLSRHLWLRRIVEI